MSDIVEHPSQEDDPQQRKPDISRAAREISWKPKVLLTIFVSLFTKFTFR